MEAVVTTPVPTAVPQPKTPALVVTSDADASQTTSETPDRAVELQPTELPESMASDPKEPGQTEEKEEAGEENAGWIIVVIVLGGGVIARAIAWMLWKKSR